jgi:non-heme chloroperoxidase
MGVPVVLIHGYPLSGASWEKQVPVLLDAGYRVITYDRRGFGKSSQPTIGYDYDTFAADLKAVIDKLDLRDAVLAGFSMGTGEVTRYLGTYGSERVVKAALLGPIPPFLLQTDDNPKGVPQSVFDGFIERIKHDRYAWFKFFFDNFYNVDKLRGTRISDEAWNASFQVAAGSSAYATLACVPTWLTDFRADLPKIDVPLLVVQGTEDRILPIDATGRRLPDLVSDIRYIEIDGGPHNVGWTHPDEVNSALMDFLK